METKENKRMSKFKVGSLLISVFLLLYIPSLLHWVYGKQIETEVVRQGVIEDSVNVDAYIVRGEEVLKSPFAGKCITEINEGEKVASQNVVATVLKDSSLPLLEELKQKDMDILKAQSELNKNKEIFSEDIFKIESEIGQKAKLISLESNSNNLGKVKQLKEEVDQLIQKKASIFGVGSNSNAHINNLMKDRERLQEQVNSNTRKITSAYSGIVSFIIDGLESTLTPSNIRNLSVKDLDNIKVKDSGKNNNVKSVEVEKPFAKVIKDFEAYLVMTLDKAKAEKYKVGDKIQEIRINQISKAIDGEVYFKSSEEDGKCILAVKIDKGISETAALRKINIDLVKTTSKGLRVPLKSLFEYNAEAKTAKIVISKLNYASIREVKVISSNEEFAIIGNLSEPGKPGVNLYDTYVLNPQNIQEGQLIN